MNKIICLDKKYSTTKQIIEQRVKPIYFYKEKFKSLLFQENNESTMISGGLRTSNYFKMSYEDKPLISIVTVVFNGEAYLERTIKSVIEQSYDSVEYIVVDGGSSDGTIDIIKKYENQIDYWISESDKGIYDAMNKGIILSQGEIVGLINADDYYQDDVFSAIVSASLSLPADIIYGDMHTLDGDKKTLSKAHGIGRKNKFFTKSIHWIVVDMLFPHPSAFIKMNTYKKIGLYDTAYRIVGDYDFMLRAYVEKLKFHYIPRSLSVFFLGGISVMSSRDILKKELEKARYNNFLFLKAFSINKSIDMMLFLKKTCRRLF
jgi:glycosyltransferase involved in cell wall biosynthesis